MAMDSVYRLSVILDMVDKMSGPLKDSSQKTQDAVMKLHNAFGTMQKVGGIMQGAGVAVIGAGMATVRATFDTQNALGELSSLGVKDLKAVEAAAKSFSDQWAGTSKADFITASYDIKSGIASLSDEGVAKFTELAALTGKATKSTTEEMGALFATGYGIYKGMYSDLSDMEFGEVFSAGIATAVKNYKTSGSEMKGAISALGATATNANVSFEEQLAILGQLQTTMSGSEAATKYKSFLNQAAAAGEALGLKFTDTNNQLLTMPEILTKLKGKYGETIDAVEKQELKKAFGTDEAVAAIDLLYNNVDTLESGVTDLRSSMQQGVSVTESMAQAIQNTPEQKFQRLKQQIHNNMEELGSNLVPAFNGAMDAASGLISKTSEWISNHQQLVSVIMTVILTLGVFLVVAGSVVATVGTIGKTVLAVQNTIKKLQTVFGALNTTFLASPVTWVIIGLVALVAAFMILWNRSEAFRSFWIGLFASVKNAVGQAKAQIAPILSELGQNLMELYQTIQPILQVIAAVGAAVLTVVVGVVMGAIRGVIAALAPIVSIVSSAVSFITNVIKMVAALLKGDIVGALQHAGSAVGNLKDIFLNGFQAVLSFLGGFASGFRSVISGALSAVGIDAGGKMSAVKNAITSKLSAAASVGRNTLASFLAGTRATLSSMVSAYREHGGGVKGAVAAMMAGAKGVFSTGFNTINSLTGGKLGSLVSMIRGKMESARSAVKGAIDKIKAAFRVTLPKFHIPLPSLSVTGKFGIKPPSVPHFSVVWHAEGGILDTPTLIGADGGTLHGAGEAGPEAILPLDVLWTRMKEILSAVFRDEKEEPGKDSGSVADMLAKRIEPVRREASLQPAGQRTGTEGKRITIHTLNIRVDMKSVKDLQMLERLIDELKDVQNQAGGDEEEYEEDFVFA